MVNWHDPVVELQCARLSLFFLHIVIGVYGWEFLVSLPFDWQHITRKRALRWTHVPYFVARYALLLAVLGGIRIANVPNPISICTQWWRFMFATGHAAVMMSSLLLAMRAIAVAESNRWVIGCLTALWLAGGATMFHAAVTIRGVYIEQYSACGVTHIGQESVNFILTAVMDIACIVIMLFALLQRKGVGLWKLLVSQGILYFIVTLIAYIPSTILIMLDLNDAMSAMLLPLTLILLVISATRMYRNLLDYVKVGPDPFSITAPSGSGRQQPERLQVGISMEIFAPDSRDADSTYAAAGDTKMTITDDLSLNGRHIQTV
ncbi:hypothetical protein EXIGLDRAFT_839834 [Exidia glandulosa HHB12029]|uniref:Uncharacterized protein n=1 Tax=Exidia glandulosa HHB12029 TaxID=1314781 RepID=A0A165ESY4_EXIGL|nr:hypothetical protein EXIGLDRAFT_839834 [Exidia glandulosa HHB12029]